jgi:hypothetical protein
LTAFGFAQNLFVVVFVITFFAVVGFAQNFFVVDAGNNSSDVPKLGAVAADLGMFQQHVFNSWGAVTAQKINLSVCELVMLAHFSCWIYYLCWQNSMGDTNLANVSNGKKVPAL